MKDLLIIGGLICFGVAGWWVAPALGLSVVGASLLSVGIGLHWLSSGKGKTE